MIQQKRSRSSDDPYLVMMPSDDPDPVMKSHDDLDWVMIQIRWWIWLEDEDDLKMNKSWRWQGLDDDPEDTEKKTCAEDPDDDPDDVHCILCLIVVLVFSQLKILMYC